MSKAFNFSFALDCYLKIDIIQPYVCLSLPLLQHPQPAVVSLRLPDKVINTTAMVGTLVRKTPICPLIEAHHSQIGL